MDHSPDPGMPGHRAQLKRLLIVLAVLALACIPLLVHVAQRDDRCHNWSQKHSMYEPPPPGCLHE